MSSVLIGVLALQGDFAKHMERLRSMGVPAKEVRTAEDLEGCDGLILPGGESTVISRQLDFSRMREKLSAFAAKKPVFGTCAGLILMAKQEDTALVKSLGILDISVERNAFGRQVDSFQAFVELHLDPGHVKVFPAYFIRAPRIRAHAPEVNILSTYQGEPILVQQGHHLGASFHPELTDDPVVHAYFVQLVRNIS